MKFSKNKNSIKYFWNCNSNLSNNKLRDSVGSAPSSSPIATIGPSTAPTKGFELEHLQAQAFLSR